MNRESAWRRLPSWLPFLVLGIGLCAISFGAILVRLAQAGGVASLPIAAWRLGLAALLITPMVLWRNFPQLAALERRQIGLALAAGLSLALHFAAWVTSLEYTSVASSTALVTTNPLWIGIASFALFGERPGRALLVGIALSLSGSALIFLSDRQHAADGANSLLGNGLALLGSWCFAAYLMIGRRLRAGLTLPVYIWLAYGVAALFLFAAAGASSAALTGFGLRSWLALIGLAVVPQLIGHTSYNWSLKHVSATFIAVVTLGEPIGSALLALIFFGETLAPLQALGFVLLLAGIYMSARGEGKRGQVRQATRS